MSEEEREEIPVYEARRLIGPHSYSDDNWQLVNYTAELRNNRDDSFFAFIDFNEHGEGRIKYCPHCEQYGFKHKLGAKIKKKGEPAAPDDEQWCSCYECGNTFATYETHIETEIKDSEQTVQTPFENESIFMSSKKRKYKDRRLKSQYDDDDDIAVEQKTHGSDNVRILQ